MPDTLIHDSYSEDGSGAALESLIRAAGDYVHPTDDLRPRTLERAQLRCRQQRRAGGTAIAALLLAVLLPSGHRQQAHLTPFNRLSISTAAQSLDRQLGNWQLGNWQLGNWQLGNRQAGVNTLRAGLGPDWALVEIFTQLRRQQAELLHGVHAAR